jgi:hypothetical protein
MKLNIGITIILSQAATLTIQAFAPSSSFTTFQQSRHASLHHHDREHAFSRIYTSSSSSSRRYNRKNTGMKMMFDQLSTAINDIAKNIGGRQRYVPFYH